MELPAFNQLSRLVKHARFMVNNKIFKNIYQQFKPHQIKMLDTLLEIKPDYNRTRYNGLKQLPKNPTTGIWRLKYTSRKDRFTAKLKGLHKFLWENLNTEHPKEILKTVNRVITGWINYHHISDNKRRVELFCFVVNVLSSNGSIVKAESTHSLGNDIIEY